MLKNLTFFICFLTHIFRVCSYECNCVPNALCLRNGSCYCPYFGDATSCSRERYQTLVKTTWNDIGKINTLVSGPLVFTIDSTNYEAMKALTEKFHGLGIWSATSRVIDSFDIQLTDLEVVTLQIHDVNVTADGKLLQIYVEFALPHSDYYYFYIHSKADVANAPCPPFSTACCVGDLGDDYTTAEGVNCTVVDGIHAPETLTRNWLNTLGGEMLSSNMFVIRLNVSTLHRTIVQEQQHNGINMTSEIVDHVVGIGMITFGKYPQNTESRVAIRLSQQTNISMFGFFQYSFVEHVNLQLERFEPYDGAQTNVKKSEFFFAHMVIEAKDIEAVHGVRYRWELDGSSGSPFEFVAPICNNTALKVCDGRYLACNVTITPVYVEIIFPVPKPEPNHSLIVYALLSKGTSISRVVSRTDRNYLDYCPATFNAHVSTVVPYELEILQQEKRLYIGPPSPVVITDPVILLNLRLHVDSQRADGRLFYISEVYLLFSKDDPTTVVVGNGGNNSFAALSGRCQYSARCYVDSIVYMGVSQDPTRCEVDASGNIVLNPSFRWPGQEVASNLVNVVMFVMVHEKISTIHTALSSQPNVARRLLRWLYPKKR